MSKQTNYGISFSSLICEQFDRIGRDNKYSEERLEKMYAYPASIDEAQLHRFANKFGYNPKLLQDGKLAPICSCCELPINTVSIDMGYPTTPNQDLIKIGQPKYLLNASTSMFFTFIKMTIAYLFLRFIITNGFNLVTNILGQNCQNPKISSYCSSNFAAKFSNYNKNTDADQIYVFIVDILNAFTVVLSIVFFTFYRNYQRKLFRLASISNHSQADYTIFVEQIPILHLKEHKNNKILADCEYKHRLKQVFEAEISALLKGIEDQHQDYYKQRELTKLQKEIKDVQKEIFNFNETQPKVTSINLCYDLTQLERINNLKQELMQKHKSDKQQGLSNDQSSEYILNQIKALNNQIIDLSIKFAKQNSPQFNTTHFLGKAFISFQYQHYKYYFLEQLKKDISLSKMDKKLKISPAAQPSDVYWYNMTVTQSQRFRSVVYSYLIMAVLLIFSFGLLLFIQYLKMYLSEKRIQQTQSSKTIVLTLLSYFLTFIMTLATIGINYALEKAIEKLTEFERHMTKTDQIISLIVKTIIAQFFNTAIIYYIISLIADIFLLNGIKSPLGDNGLIMNITSLIAVSGFIQIITNCVQFGERLSDYQYNKKYSQLNNANFFQVELNKELQPTEFSFAVRYAYYILNVFVVSFYSYIVPYTSFILFVYFIFQYWIDKQNLFKRFSSPTNFSYRLSMFTLKIFEWSIFFFALGNLLFSLTIHTNTHGGSYIIINIISVCLALAYCLSIFFLPQKWLQLITFSKIDLDHTSYTSSLKNLSFNKVYKIQNPATNFANDPESVSKIKRSLSGQYNRANQLASKSDVLKFKQYKPKEQLYAQSDFGKQIKKSKEAQQ